MFRLIAIAVGSLSMSLAYAQSSNFDGTWQGNLETKSGVRFPTVVEINGDEGTWTYSLHGQTISPSQKDPCSDKKFPLKATKRNERELGIRVERASVLSGCSNSGLILTLTEQNKLEGTFQQTGSKVSLSRKE